MCQTGLVGVFLEFPTEKKHSVVAFHAIHGSLRISWMCYTLSAAQVRLLLLREVFSTSCPFQCAKERGVPESCFAHNFNDTCAFGQETVSLS